MTESEYYATRSRTLLEAAEAEMDSELEDALLEQCFRLQRRAIVAQLLERAQKVLPPVKINWPSIDPQAS